MADTLDRKTGNSFRLVALALLLIGFVPSWYLLGAVTSRFSWAERDWNDDGRTTLSEYFHAVELGARAAACPDGSLGTEYFRLKDGLPDKVDCSRAWTADPRQVKF